MIPKKIHYVWLGKKEKPYGVVKCINTWKKHLKDYEIIEWNEENFDINSNLYVKTAYDQKKWAYASDYIRLYAIYNEGGIYLDTDVIVLESFDKFLNDKAFFGFENDEYISAAIFGAEKSHPMIKEYMEYYDNKAFSFDTQDQYKEVNTKSVSSILEKYGCLMNNTKQLLKENIRIYPDKIFQNPSKECTSIHIYTGTWLEEKSKFKKKLNDFIKLRLTNRFKVKLYVLLKGRK